MDAVERFTTLRTMQVEAALRHRSEGSTTSAGATTAYRLRCDGHTIPFIAARLNADGLRPLKAAQYTWHSVQDLLRSAVYHDRSTPRRAGAISEGTGDHSLREICVRHGAGGALSARWAVVSTGGAKLLMWSARERVAGAASILIAVIARHQPFSTDGEWAFMADAFADREERTVASQRSAPGGQVVCRSVGSVIRARSVANSATDGLHDMRLRCVPER